MALIGLGCARLVCLRSVALPQAYQPGNRISYPLLPLFGRNSFTAFDPSGTKAVKEHEHIHTGIPGAVGSSVGSFVREPV